MKTERTQARSPLKTSCFIPRINPRKTTISGQLLASLILSFCVLAPALLLSGCKGEDKEKKFSRLVESAAAYRAQGKFEEARIQLLAAIDAKPNDPKAYTELGEVSAVTQNFAKALEYFNTALHLDPAYSKARLQLASLLLVAKQWDLAEKHIKELLSRDPKDEQTRILLANLNASGPNKQLPEARRILSEVLAENKNNIVAHASLADVAIAEGKPEEAEELFLKGIQIDPSNSPMRMALADLYVRQGRLEEAQTILAGLVSENPENAGLHYFFGEFLLSQGLAKKAFEQYEATLKADPLRHEARDRLYDMYLNRGKTAEAKALSKALADAQPNDPGVWYFQARDLMIDNKKAEALALLKKAANAMRSFSPASRFAGLIEIELGNSREGLEHLNQAVSVNPADIGARLALARNLFRKRELGQATEHVDKILERFPRQLGANILRADIALVEGDINRARAVYDFLTKAFPNNPVGYFKLGLLEERSGKPEQALEWYRKTLAFDRGILIPARRLVAIVSRNSGLDAALSELNELKQKSANQKPEYSFVIGHVLLSRKSEGDLENARALFLEALDERPSLVEAYFALASLDSAGGNYPAAVKNYEKILAANPKHIPTRMLVALAREQQGLFEEAAKDYRKILELSPRFAPAANNLAWLLAEKLNGSLDEALRLSELAKEELPSSGAAADTLGWIYFRRKSPRAALPFLEEALELDAKEQEDGRQNPEILYHLAAVQSALGDKAAASKYANQALELGGPEFAYRRQLEELLKENAS